MGSASLKLNNNLHQNMKILVLILGLISTCFAAPNKDAVRWGDSSLEQRIPNSCNTRQGETCVFPFSYQGVTHYQCTYSDSPTPWCATQTDSSGAVVTNKWGDVTMTPCPPPALLKTSTLTPASLLLVSVSSPSDTRAQYTVHVQQWTEEVLGAAQRQTFMENILRGMRDLVQAHVLDTQDVQDVLQHQQQLQPPRQQQQQLLLASHQRQQPPQPPQLQLLPQQQPPAHPPAA